MPKVCKLDPEIRINVIGELYRLGIPMAWICKEFGIAHQTIKKDMAQAGIESLGERTKAVIFAHAFKRYARLYVSAWGECEKLLQEKLAKYLGISEITDSFIGFDAFTKALALPNYGSDINEGYVKLLQTVFGEKQKREKSVKELWCEFLYKISKFSIEKMPTSIKTLSDQFFCLIANEFRPNIGPEWTDKVGEEIEEVLSGLPQRDVNILKLHFGIGVESRTLEGIGKDEKFSITDERVRQIELRTINKLRQPVHLDRLERFWRVTVIPAIPQRMQKADYETVEFLQKIATKVNYLEISVRTANCFKSDHIETVEQLILRTERDLMRIQNFGYKSLNEIKEILASMGLALAKNPSVLRVGMASAKERLGCNVTDLGLPFSVCTALLNAGIYKIRQAVVFNDEELLKILDSHNSLTTVKGFLSAIGLSLGMQLPD